MLAVVFNFGAHTENECVRCPAQRPACGDRVATPYRATHFVALSGPTPPHTQATAKQHGRVLDSVVRSADLALAGFVFDRFFRFRAERLKVARSTTHSNEI